MLVHDFVVVPVPFLDLRDRLAAQGPALLTDSVAAAAGDAGQIGGVPVVLKHLLDAGLLQPAGGDLAVDCGDRQQQR